MTLWRGNGGTGSASSEVDTTQFQEFLVQSQAAQAAAEAARDAALIAETNAETAETNAETAETNAETAATNAASSASAAASSASSASTSATNAASSATSAANSASAAAASAASINPADIVHISGTETITGAKTFSQIITGSITGNAGTVTNGVVTTGSYSDPAWITSLAGSKVSGNISGNAANVTGTVAIANGGTGSTTASTARAALGIAIGTDVQAWDADLDTWATKTAPSGTVVGTSDTQTLTNKTLTSPTLTTPNINSAQFATVSGTAPIYPCRAWVNFNGTGTVAIRASGNVSSITDNGVGDYTVNFATAMPDANYQVSMSSVSYTNTNFSTVAYLKAGLTNTVAATKTTTQLNVAYAAPSSSVYYDCAEMNVAIFR